MRPIFLAILLFIAVPMAGFAQCSGQYDLTYPAGSTTTTITINNGSGSVNSTFCPSPTGTQSLVFVPRSDGTVRLDRDYNGTTTTLQTYSTVRNNTYTFTLPTVSSQAVYTLYSEITCSNTKNSIVTLTLAPTLALTSSLTTLCNGSSATLTATGSSDGTYTWSAPGMNSVTNSGTLTVTPSDNTIYTVTAPTSCNSSTQQQLALTVPTLTVSPASAGICPGGSTVLTVADNVAGNSYIWTVNGSTVGTGPSLTVSPSSNTTYRVTSSNASGCTNTAFRDVAVTIGPSVNVTSSKQGSTTTLTAAASFQNATYAWRTGGSNGTVVANGPTFTTSPAQTTTYTVTATSGSCTSSRDATVTGSAPLPVELTAFQTQWLAATPVLTWTTASERNNAYFQVERSLDGLRFEVAGQVEGSGTSSAPRAYRFEDAGVPASLSGKLYYRLRQVDFSGETAFSPVQVLQPSTKQLPLTVSVYPNPLDKASMLRLQAPMAGAATCTIYNAVGQVVATKHFETTAGLQLLPLPAMTGAQAGLYYLQVSQQGQQQTVRLQQR